MKIKNKWKKRIPYLVGLLVVVAIVIASFTTTEKEAQAAPKPLEVTTIYPEKKKVTEWDEFTGRFEATNRVEVRARVSGYITSVNFKDGQQVQKGDVLFTIDARPFAIALQEAQAAYQQARANYQQAANNFVRIKDLQASGAISAEEYDQRQQGQAAALAQMQLTKAAVDNASLNLSFTQVRAPITGRVSRDFINEGNLVIGGTGNATLLTTIVATDPIHFYFTISESDVLQYSRLVNNDKTDAYRNSTKPVEIQLADETNYTHKGTLDFIDNEITSASGTMEMRAIFENKEGLLAPGMFGRARLQRNTNRMVVLIPDRLVNTNQTEKFVYTIAQDSTIEATQVKVGDLHQGQYRIIKQGLDTNSLLVTNNLLKVKPGQKVVYQAAKKSSTNAPAS
ncbi:MAG: efflux RND transporter periplasmic adaptor subunit [Thermonemataceae bacterium]